MRSIVTLGLVGLALFAFGCGGDGSTTPTPISYDGTWRGTDSSGGAFSFVVAGNAVTRLEVNVHYGTADGRCGGYLAAGQNVSPAGVSSNGVFSVPLHWVWNSYDYTLTWAGTLTSASAGSGTGTYTVVMPDCQGQTNVPVSGSVTWTATK